MKALVILNVLLLFACTHQPKSEIQLTISNQVYQNSHLAFISHNSPTPFGRYLSMEINYPPVQKLLIELQEKLKVELLSRGEAHITVITPPEYEQQIAPHLTQAEIDEIAVRHNIQKAQFEIICIGRGQKRIDGQIEKTFYIVVRSEDLLSIRKNVAKRLIEKTKQEIKFKPEHFYPHITLGFTKHDLHESDGVLKNIDTCVADLNLLESL